ncbi:hypothetical protein [Maritalea myrionectae]|uniref:hypothetical protein n=1 Tax=Maritalea myrionectae TaxID=454601 RepID=UPI0012EC4611|nr:hypothetical protein [Maritalea myrionectae]
MIRTACHKLSLLNVTFLALAFVLAIATALPVNGATLVFGDHGHEVVAQDTHAHSAKTGYEMGCGDQASVHCGVKIAVAGWHLPTGFVAIAHSYAQSNMQMLLARSIAQEIPPPRL